MATIAFRCTDEMSAALRGHAASEMRSLNGVLTLAVTRYLKSVGVPVVEKKHPTHFSGPAATTPKPKAAAPTPRQPRSNDEEIEEALDGMDFGGDEDAGYHPS